MGVGCHFLLQGIVPTQGSNQHPLHWQVDSLPLSQQRSPFNHLSVHFSCSVVSDSLRPHGLQTARLLCSWNFPGKSTGVGCYFLLQGIFPTQGLNPGLPHCRQTLYRLSHQGSQFLQRHSHLGQQWPCVTESALKFQKHQILGEYIQS